MIKLTKFLLILKQILYLPSVLKNGDTYNSFFKVYFPVFLNSERYACLSPKVLLTSNITFLGVFLLS